MPPAPPGKWWQARRNNPRKQFRHLAGEKREPLVVQLEHKPPQSRQLHPPLQGYCPARHWGVRTVFSTNTGLQAALSPFLGGSQVAGVLKCPLQQESIKVSCLPRRVIICLRTLVQKRPAFVQRQADQQHWDKMLPGSHWLSTCAKSKCLPCTRELGEKKKKRQP